MDLWIQIMLTLPGPLLSRYQGSPQEHALQRVVLRACTRLLWLASSPPNVGLLPQGSVRAVLLCYVPSLLKDLMPILGYRALRRRNLLGQ